MEPLKPRQAKGRQPAGVALEGKRHSLIHRGHMKTRGPSERDRNEVTGSKHPSPVKPEVGLSFKVPSSLESSCHLVGTIRRWERVAHKPLWEAEPACPQILGCLRTTVPSTFLTFLTSTRPRGTKCWIVRAGEPYL